MKAKRVVAEFMSDNGIDDPQQVIDVLCDWFDEHDETEQLAEYLVFVAEERDHRGSKTTRKTTDGDGA